MVWRILCIFAPNMTKNNIHLHYRLLECGISININSMKKLLFLIAVLTLFGVTSRGSVTHAAEYSMELGKLYFVNLEQGEQPVMTGLSLFGNRCGSKDFNHKPCAAEGIRSVFELDEWIEFHPQTNVTSGIKVMVFMHKDDQNFYLKNILNDETPDYILECELNKDPDAEETSHWGSFYLHPEEVNPGYYDFVFIYNNKVFATMLTKFYKPDELLDKPDSELEKLMKD